MALGLPAGLTTLHAGPWLKQFGFGIDAFSYLLLASGALLLVAAVAGFRWLGPITTLRELGIVPIRLMAVFAGILSVAVMLAALSVTGRTILSHGAGPLIVMRLVYPVSDEILFRGFVFRQLRRWAVLPFWAAATLSSLLFGAGYFGQGAVHLSTLLIPAAAFGGGVLFCWLTERWDSIWPALVIHVGFNLVWQVFLLGDDTAGGAAANLARLAAVAAAIIATLVATSPSRRAAMNPQPAP
ncbi:MAG: CPBP family intramembrane metalloprotease [Alphaproteobacteria bacterium]|nr:CPBP family intramembrane metalloprotease [Alphaproteobacteria bacterium]MDE2495690.1 CPBP family intramembrane metalloprotease [Alphaproteobacteria bacterium]